MIKYLKFPHFPVFLESVPSAPLLVKTLLWIWIFLGKAIDHQPPVAGGFKIDRWVVLNSDNSPHRRISTFFRFLWIFPEMNIPRPQTELTLTNQNDQISLPSSSNYIDFTLYPGDQPLSGHHHHLPQSVPCFLDPRSGVKLNQTSKKHEHFKLWLWDVRCDCG